MGSVSVHVHDKGGTSPAVVEIMHFGVTVIAHGCVINRYATEEKASYCETPEQLVLLARDLTPKDAVRIGADMREIAQRRYTWDIIGEAYFALLEQA